MSIVCRMKEAELVRLHDKVFPTCRAVTATVRRRHETACRDFRDKVSGANRSRGRVQVRMRNADEN